MGTELVVGLISAVIFVGLLIIGLPKGGVSPRFLRNSWMQDFYPVTALFFS